MSHHIARICHITSPAYVTCPHMSHRPHMSHHITCICHMPAYVTCPHMSHRPHMSHSRYMSHPPPPEMSYQPFEWKMLVRTFQFTVRYKWSERKAPVLCTCFKIHYSFSMQKQKNDTNEVSVHVGKRAQYKLN